MKRIIFGLALLVSVASFAQSKREIKATFSDGYATQFETYTPSFNVDGKEVKVRNVILMICDGMGMGAVNAALLSNAEGLTMTNLQTIGFARTQSADAFVTDSAASATAFATGQKTNNGYLGMNTEGERIENICEKLEKLGIISGMITTDNVYGATPSAFFAHQTERTNKKGIWADFAQSNLTFVAAGDKKKFDTLDGNLQEAVIKQYTVVNSLEDEAVKDSKKLLCLPKKVGGNSGTFLTESTVFALDYLKSRSKKGFFLMIEGGEVDHDAHDANIHPLLNEMKLFDLAVAEAVKFAEKDGHTLVIVTGDHETGMLAPKSVDMSTTYVSAHFGHKGHSGMMVPVFAYGPHSKEFGVVQENSDICNLVFRLLSARK